MEQNRAPEALHSTARRQGWQRSIIDDIRKARNLGVSAARGGDPCERARSLGAVRWDRLTLGIGLGYALLAWSLSYGAILPQLRDDLHLSASVAALHGSMFGFCLLGFALFGNRVLAALSNRATLGLAVLAMVGGGAMFGIGRTPALTLTGAAITGAGAALLVIVVPAVVFAHQPQAPTQTMSTLNAFPMISSTLLPLAVSLAAAVAISWRVAYLAPVLLIGAAITITAGRAPVPSTAVEQPAKLAHIARVPLLARRWLVLVFGVMVEIGTVIWASSIMRDLGHASKNTAASLTIGFFIGMFVGRLTLTKLLDRINEHHLLMLSFIGSLGFLAPFLIGPGLAVRIIGLTGLGVFLSPVYPLSVSRIFELHDDTNTLGRVTAIASGVGVTFGPLLLGTLSDSFGLAWATVVLPAFAIAGLVSLGRPAPA